MIFGKTGDSGAPGLGATTRERLELVLDPIKRQLRPMTVTLTGAAPFR